MRNLRFLLLALLTCLVSGCATPMVVSLKKHNTHYIPNVSSDKGRVYIYREFEYVGCARGLYINADGKRIGAVNSGTYFVYESDPGKLEISVENWLGKNPSREIDVEVKKVYYLKTGIKMGLWDADPYINIVTTDEGQQTVPKLTYATMYEKDLIRQNKEIHSKK